MRCSRRHLGISKLSIKIKSFIFQDAEAKDLYVKRSDGTSAYEGWCWPGSSSWIDFVSPDIRQWWAEQFAPDKYQVRDKI